MCVTRGAHRSIPTRCGGKVANQTRAKTQADSELGAQGAHTRPSSATADLRRGGRESEAILFFLRLGGVFSAFVIERNDFALLQSLGNLDVVSARLADRDRLLGRLGLFVIGVDEPDVFLV